MDGINLQGQPGELRMVLEITRAATGKTETVELIGHIIPEAQDAQVSKEGTSDGNHS